MGVGYCLWFVNWEAHVLLMLYWSVMFLLILTLFLTFFTYKEKSEANTSLLKPKVWLWDVNHVLNDTHGCHVICLCQWNNTHFHHLKGLIFIFIHAHPGKPFWCNIPDAAKNPSVLQYNLRVGWCKCCFLSCRLVSLRRDDLKRWDFFGVSLVIWTVNWPGDWEGNCPIQPGKKPVNT